MASCAVICGGKSIEMTFIAQAFFQKSIDSAIFGDKRRLKYWICIQFSPFEASAGHDRLSGATVIATNSPNSRGV
jgi:hypothetical protein